MTAHRKNTLVPKPVVITVVISILTFAAGSLIGWGKWMTREVVDTKTAIEMHSVQQVATDYMTAKQGLEMEKRVIQAFHDACADQESKTNAQFQVISTRQESMTSKLNFLSTNMEVWLERTKDLSGRIDKLENPNRKTQ